MTSLELLQDIISDLWERGRHNLDDREIYDNLASYLQTCANDMPPNIARTGLAGTQANDGDGSKPASQ